MTSRLSASLQCRDSGGKEVSDFFSHALVHLLPGCQDERTRISAVGGHRFSCQSRRITEQFARVIRDGSFSFVGRSKMLIQKTFFKLLIVGREKKKQEEGETLIFQPARLACNPTCLSVIAENEVQ